MSLHLPVSYFCMYHMLLTDTSPWVKGTNEVGSSSLPKVIAEGPSKASIMVPGGFALALATIQQEKCALGSLFLRKIPFVKNLG